ncbi:MAG TPA: zf-HC2 domain-containing protein [Acidimicrobiales bacterium]|nr:zf-HC2 domain-containing protein [Acidimicrobiales bacterium]
MQCDAHRTILSAALDGEASPIERRAADAHVAGCRDCARWFEAATAVTRAARLAPARPVPDLAAKVLALVPS